MSGLCDMFNLKDALYAGYSWGVPSKKFYADVAYSGPGLRKDRVLFGEKVWAKAHLVGQREQYFDGERFYLSDHFGVMGYVDVSDLYASRAKQDIVAAMCRRQQIARLVEQNEQKEKKHCSA